MLLARSDTVCLRRLAARDLSVFQAYRRDPVVGAYQDWSQMDDAEAEGFLTAMGRAPGFEAGAWWQIGIVRTADDYLIGDIGVCLSSDGSEVELGITLARSAQGFGLGAKAVELVCDLIFAQTDARRIIAITLEQNSRALALLHRTDFVEALPIRTEFEGAPALERVFVLNRA